MIASRGKCIVWCVVLAALLCISCSALRAATRPGVIRVEVDETRAPQRILHTHLTIPVQAGTARALLPAMDSGRAHAATARSTTSPD